MNNENKDLLVARFVSLGDLLAALNELPDNGSGQLCEQVRYGGTSDLLLSCKKELALSCFEKLASKPSFKIIENFHHQLISCFFHLENKPVLGSVVVLETRNLIELIVCLDDALKCALDVVEISIPRYENAMLTLIITGAENDLSAFYNKHTNNNEFKVTFIKNVKNCLSKFY